MTPRVGVVYVLTNPAIPGMVKVGMTRGSPHARAQALSTNTAVPSAFRVAWFAEVGDCAAVERAVQRALGRYRVNGRREFFSVTVDEARHAIQKAAGYSMGRETIPRPSPRQSGRPYRATPLALGKTALRLTLILVLLLSALGLA